MTTSKIQKLRSRFGRLEGYGFDDPKSIARLIEALGSYENSQLVLGLRGGKERGVQADLEMDATRDEARTMIEKLKKHLPTIDH
jgi:hypothetical protein